MNTGYMRFMRDIKSLAKKHSFAICGNEPHFKNEAFLALVKAIKALTDTDEDRYDAHDKTTKTGTVDDALCEYPLIGNVRLISLLNADHLKNLKSLSYWFDEPPEDTRAVFEFTEDTKRPPEELKFDVVVVCNSVGVESKEFLKYIDFCLEGTDATLSKDAVEYSKKVFANNLHIMKQELVKTALFIKPRTEIEVNDLVLTTAGYPTSKVFDMVDALVQRDITTSLILLDDLMSQGTSPTFITHLLTQRLKVLQGAQRAFINGERLKEYMIRKKIPLFQYDQIARGTKVLKEFHITKFYDVLAEAEFRLKSFGSEMYKRSIAEKMIVSLCR